MGIIFYGIVTPTGLLVRMFRKDILKLNKNNNNTYWENRENSNNNMRDQF